jgi:hypothetical protein
VAGIEEGAAARTFRYDFLDRLVSSPGWLSYGYDARRIGVSAIMPISGTIPPTGPVACEGVREGEAIAVPKTKALGMTVAGESTGAMAGSAK